MAYVTRNGGRFQLALMDLATRQTQILTDSDKDESPSFAPNGRMILYACMLQFDAASAGRWDLLLADCRDSMAEALGIDIPDRWLQRAGRVRGPHGTASLAFGHHGALRQALLHLQQPDGCIAGRSWQTEVGLRQVTPASPVVVTIVLRMQNAGLAALAQRFDASHRLSLIPISEPKRPY